MAADRLAEQGGDWLSLSGLKTLAPEAAAALTTFGARDLGLCGLEPPPQEAVAPLGKFRGDTLRLNGLTTISAVCLPRSPAVWTAGKGRWRSAVSRAFQMRLSRPWTRARGARAGWMQDALGRGRPVPRGP